MHVKGGVSGGEVADVHGLVGVVPLMAIGAVEGETAQDDVVDEMLWIAFETEELGQAWGDNFGVGDVEIIGSQEVDFAFDGVKRPFAGLIDAFECVFDAKWIIGVYVVGSGCGEDRVLVGFVHTF